jgi:perosamine synthetase
MSERIPVAGPWVTEKEVAMVAQAAAEGWYEHSGLYPQRFEEAFARYLGVRFAVAVPHCTAAIHLALASLNIGPGDEVIVPDITWIASVAPVCYVGATPVFADVDPSTWCLSVESVRACITERTKAIISVGLYGLMPDMNALSALAAERGLKLIEDAAQALGSRLGGRLAGTFGDVGVFSFHGSKLLTTGEGGMFVTADEHILERVLLLRDHGRSKGSFYNTEVGFKYRMSGLQAAFGLAQLERIEELIERKREIFAWYHQRLAGVPGMKLNAEPEGYFSTYWMTTAVLDESRSLDSHRLMQALAGVDIDTRPFFHPLSSLPAFSASPQAKAAQARNRTAYWLSPKGLNLPSAMRLTRPQVERVCDVLLGILG